MLFEFFGFSFFSFFFGFIDFVTCTLRPTHPNSGVTAAPSSSNEACEYSTIWADNGVPGDVSMLCNSGDDKSCTDIEIKCDRASDWAYSCDMAYGGGDWSCSGGDTECVNYEPTNTPTVFGSPTDQPTATTPSPTEVPTTTPTIIPTIVPTSNPTSNPTGFPAGMDTSTTPVRMDVTSKAPTQLPSDEGSATTTSTTSTTSISSSTSETTITTSETTNKPPLGSKYYNSTNEDQPVVSSTIVTTNNPQQTTTTSTTDGNEEEEDASNAYSKAYAALADLYEFILLGFAGAVLIVAMMGYIDANCFRMNELYTFSSITFFGAYSLDFISGKYATIAFCFLCFFCLMFGARICTTIVVFWILIASVSFLFLVCCGVF